jgi:hypothetical protein
MSADCFQSLDVNRFHRALADLHRVVGTAKGRVEISCEGGNDNSDGVCVLISKAELESLERALAIFAETVEFEHMSKQIAEIVAAADGAPSVGEARNER